MSPGFADLADGISFVDYKLLPPADSGLTSGAMVLPPHSMTTYFLRMACQFLEAELYNVVFNADNLATYKKLGTDLFQGTVNLHTKAQMDKGFRLPFVGAVSTSRADCAYELG